MRLVDRIITVPKKTTVVEVHPLGDIHVGARNCAERHLKKRVAAIAKNPYAYVLGGGDWLDAILPQDNKRFDFDTLPDWMLDGDAEKVRDRLKDVLKQQRKRLKQILTPIPPDRWLGALEGNHCASIGKYHNRNIHEAVCHELQIEPLTDEALIRLRFRWSTMKTTVIIYIRHGYGSGRAAGAEPNKLAAMLAEWEIADICFTGHTHTFCIAPPKPVLGIPKCGGLPPEPTCRYRWAGNWGCWLTSHPVGPPSYASRACYPARPLLSCYATIQPFRASTPVPGYRQTASQIEIRQVTL